MWFNQQKGTLLARADEPELVALGEPNDRTLFKQFADANLVNKLAVDKPVTVRNTYE